MADKELLNAETVAELAPLLKTIVEAGESPAKAFTELGYSMHVVGPVLASMLRVGAVTPPSAPPEDPGMTAGEVDTTVRLVFGIPEPIPMQAKAQP